MAAVEDLRRRLAKGKLSLTELMDWLPRLEAEGVACRVGWVDALGRPCERGMGELALLYEGRRHNE